MVTVDPIESVDYEEIQDDDNYGVEINHTPVKKRQVKENKSEWKENECVTEKEFKEGKTLNKKGGIKTTPTALDIYGKEIPCKPVIITLKGVKKKESIILSKDIDFEILISLNEDRLKNNLLISETKLSFISNKTVSLLCYGFDKDLSETCIDRFCRIYTCKSTIVDDVLINNGVEILESIINYSGFSKYMSILLELKDIIKLNQSIDFDMRSITGGNSNNSKTFNISEITKLKVKDIAYRTGISESSIAYMCCLSSLSFSNNTINNVEWFKENFVEGDNNFINTKVLKWFVNQKGILKSVLSNAIKRMYEKYITSSYYIRKVGVINTEIDRINYIIRLYNLLRKLDQSRMIDNSMHIQLNDDIDFIRNVKNSIKNKV